MMSENDVVDLLKKAEHIGIDVWKARQTKMKFDRK